MPRKARAEGAPPAAPREAGDTEILAMGRIFRALKTLATPRAKARVMAMVRDRIEEEQAQTSLRGLGLGNGHTPITSTDQQQPPAAT